MTRRRERSRQCHDGRDAVGLAISVRNVRRVDGERGEGGCDLCRGKTRIARGGIVVRK